MGSDYRGSEFVGIHNPGNWSAGKNGCCVVSDAPGFNAMSGEFDSYYGGYLICESIGRSNVPIVAAAPKMLQALVRVRDAIRCFDITMADDIKAVDKVIAAATTPIAPVESVSVPEPVCETQKEKPPLGIVPVRLWIEARRDDIYAAVDRYREAEYVVSAHLLLQLASIEAFLQDDSGEAQLVIQHPERIGETCKQSSQSDK